MISRTWILSIVVGAATLFPLAASAQAIVTDTLDTYNTLGWTSLSSSFLPLPDLETVGCFLGNCVITGDSKPAFSMEYVGTAQSSGEQFYYVKSDNTYGGDFHVVLSISGALSSPQADIEIGNSDLQDTGWHLEGVAWQQGGTDLEYQTCSDSACSSGFPTGSWSDSGTANFTPAALTFYNSAGLSSSIHIFIDQISGSSVPPTINTATRIDTVTPMASSTIATSTGATFGVTGYVNPNDYVDGMNVTIQYAPYVASQEVVACTSCLFTKLSFNIATSGVFSFSTTSPALVQGRYTMQTQLNAPSTFSFFNLFSFVVGSNSLTSTSTTFVTGQLNGFDEYIDASSAAINDYLASSTISLASCSSFTSFNLGDCINLLFVPQAVPMEQLWANFRQQFLSYYPWGYVTRFFTILGGSATSTIPVVSVSIPTPYTAGNANDATILTIDTPAMFAEGSADLNSVNANGTDQNFQDVMEPYVQIFIAISLLFIVVHDLIGLARVRRK